MKHIQKIFKVMTRDSTAQSSEHCFIMKEFAWETFVYLSDPFYFFHLYKLRHCISKFVRVYVQQFGIILYTTNTLHFLFIGTQTDFHFLFYFSIFLYHNFLQCLSQQALKYFRENTIFLYNRRI